MLDYGARWYDPSIARFNGVDPTAEDFPHVTIYNYGENEPVRHRDLWGLQKYYDANGHIGNVGNSTQKRLLHPGTTLKSENLIGNSSEIMEGDNILSSLNNFKKNYGESDKEHIQNYFSRYLADEDGAYFKGIVASEPGTSNKKGEVNLDAASLPFKPTYNWTLEANIHNHPSSSKHRFSLATPDLLSGGLKGDYYEAVSNKIDIYAFHSWLNSTVVDIKEYSFIYQNQLKIERLKNANLELKYRKELEEILFKNKTRIKQKGILNLIFPFDAKSYKDNPRTKHRLYPYSLEIYNFEDTLKLAVQVLDFDFKKEDLNFTFKILEINNENIILFDSTLQKGDTLIFPLDYYQRLIE